MFVNHHFDAEMFVHRDRLLADAAESRLARVARAARRRRRRESASTSTGAGRNLTAATPRLDDREVARGPRERDAAGNRDVSRDRNVSRDSDVARNRDEKRRSAVRA